MKPRVAFFDFTGCEGCQLDALNLEPDELLGLLGAVDIVNFREVRTDRSDEYDIAFIEGSITRESEIARLKEIRERAAVLVALGACACTGGINCMKNAYETEELLKGVYGDCAAYYDTIPTRPADAVVKVDAYIRGCPPTTTEFVKVVKSLLLGKKADLPNYPVCTECRRAGNICVFQRGGTCIGPVTRAGCDALCVSAGRFCWGCRGLVDDPNLDSEKDILARYGLTIDQILEHFRIYNSCTEATQCQK
ncbi:NADH ubiquinone oxidoreductase 20 kDa subunit [Dehalogenimonas lykanthroporepellens BL-DC-9]|nr:NADH ubiquinone oxidoreductase 20 kDa subunit [Dehalogenimonas lykanthroporepellens BL-DC-9]